MNNTTIDNTLIFNVKTYYCNHETDVYSILTSIYYIVFGLLGLTVNNSSVNDIHTYVLLTGIGFIVQFSTNTTFFGPVPLVISSCNILNKLACELIKKWTNERFDEKDVIIGIQADKIHRVPVVIVSILIALYVCFSVILYNIFFTVPILLVTQLTTVYAVIRFFPKGTQLYSLTRSMIIKLGISVLIGCFGLVSSLYCPTDAYSWLRVFMGHPIANLTIPYSLYTATQLIILIRGKNLRRTVSVRGNSFIYISYYTGREKIEF